MSRESYLVQNAIDGVFRPRSPVPSRFLGSDLILPCRTCFLTAKCFTCDAYLVLGEFLPRFTAYPPPQYYSPFTASNQIKAVPHMSIKVPLVPERAVPSEVRSQLYSCHCRFLGSKISNPPKKKNTSCWIWIKHMFAMENLL